MELRLAYLDERLVLTCVVLSVVAFLPLGKDAIIAATTGLDLGAAMPDFDARYHDFRADAHDANRVWCTMRVTATHTGVLSFGGVKATTKAAPMNRAATANTMIVSFFTPGLPVPEFQEKTAVPGVLGTAPTPGTASRW